MSTDLTAPVVPIILVFINLVSSFHASGPFLVHKASNLREDVYYDYYDPGGNDYYYDYGDGPEDIIYNKGSNGRFVESFANYKENYDLENDNGNGMDYYEMEYDLGGNKGFQRPHPLVRISPVPSSSLWNFYSRNSFPWAYDSSKGYKKSKQSYHIPVLSNHRKGHASRNRKGNGTGRHSNKESSGKSSGGKKKPFQFNGRSLSWDDEKNDWDWESENDSDEKIERVFSISTKPTTKPTTIPPKSSSPTDSQKGSKDGNKDNNGVHGKTTNESSSDGNSRIKSLPLTDDKSKAHPHSPSKGKQSRTFKKSKHPVTRAPLPSSEEDATNKPIKMEINPVFNERDYIVNDPPTNQTRLLSSSSGSKNSESKREVDTYPIFHNDEYSSTTNNSLSSIKNDNDSDEVGSNNATQTTEAPLKSKFSEEVDKPDEIKEHSKELASTEKPEIVGFHIGWIPDIEDNVSEDIDSVKSGVISLPDANDYSVKSPFRKRRRVRRRRKQKRNGTVTTSATTTSNPTSTK